MSVVPNLVDIRCWNHILQDCGRWLTDKGCSKKEVNCYKDHLRYMFSQDSREKVWKQLINDKRHGWMTLKKSFMTEYRQFDKGM